MTMSKKNFSSEKRIGKSKAYKAEARQKVADHKTRHVDPEKEEKTEDVQQRTRRVIQNLLIKLQIENIVRQKRVVFLMIKFVLISF